MKSEVSYNISLIKKCIDKTDKNLRNISTDDTEVYEIYRMTDFQRHFTQLCFQQGIIYDSLTPVEFDKLNSILIHFDFFTTQYLNDNIVNWGKGELNKVKAKRIFEFERKQLIEYKDLLDELINKIEYS